MFFDRDKTKNKHYEQTLIYWGGGLQKEKKSPVKNGG